MPRCRVAFVFFVAMLFPLASYAEAKEDLVIGVAQFPGTLHPYFEPTYLGSYMRGFATRQVTAFDADWKSVCLICTEIPSLENGRLRPESTANDGTGLAATYTLRPDLYWGDGEKVTTKDVEFTWRVTHDPNSGALLAGDTWRQIARVEVVDEQTAILHFQPQSYRFNRIPELLPEHIEAPAHARAVTPADYMNNTSYARAPTTPGLYNGPYLLVGYQRGAEIVLEPNPYWRGPKPGFKRILVRTIADTAALQANLLSGDLDMVTGDGGISMTVDQVIPLEKRFPDRFVYLIKPTPNFVRVDLALETPVLADVRVRRALLMAIDRQTIVRTIYDNRATVADTWMPPLDPSYAPDAATYAYDPPAAKALLAEAGWIPDADGICRNAAGERLSFEFTTISGNRQYELLQVVLKSQWRAVGVEVTLKTQEFRSLIESVKHAFTGMALYAWTGGGPGWVPDYVYSTSKIPTAANNWSGGNVARFSNPTMDADLARAAAEFDVVTQKPFLVEAQRIYADQLPQLPLLFRPEGHIIPKWLKGYATTGLSWPSSLWAESWHRE